MKIKNVTIEIKPLKDVLKDTGKAIGRVKSGKRIKHKKGLSFGDVGDFREFFTPKRLELLRIIKHKHPESIYQLAKFTKRDFKSVFTDLKVLEKYNLIDTEKVRINGSYRIKPIFDYDKLCVDIAV